METPVDPCVLPTIPVEPYLNVMGKGQGCPEGYVCITRDSAVDLALYIREVKRVRYAMAECPLWLPEEP